jgi:hypothetical protein
MIITIWQFTSLEKSCEKNREHCTLSQSAPMSGHIGTGLGALWDYMFLLKIMYHNIQRGLY